jgi:hypothetical protein
VSNLELYKTINETLSIIAWPVVVLIGLLVFRKSISELISRFKDVEGKFGNVTFKLGLEKVINEAVTKAVELENAGKPEEAKKIVSDAGQVLSALYSLTPSDIRYLIHLKDGGQPKRKWGAIHLVRAGLVNFEGGQITEHGKKLIENYKRISDG